jgi:predicted RNA-binding protein with PIN domain
MLQKLEDQRNALVKFIEVYRPQGSIENRVTIVFDGKEDVYSPEVVSSVKVIFARGHSADDEIRKIVEEAVNKRNIVVVSNDRAIQYSVRAYGAKVLSVQDFCAKAKHSVEKSHTNHAQSMKSSKTNESSKYISQIKELEITTEFENIWLKKSKKADGK